MLEDRTMTNGTSRAQREPEAYKAMSCSELAAFLSERWDALPDWDRAYLTSLGSQRGCQEVVPYLVQQLGSEDATSRWRALAGLGHLRRRECRGLFLESHLKDPDQEVREMALVLLSGLFRGEEDAEILRLGLAAFDGPTSSVATRLYAGAAMMYQLHVPEDLGSPMWWDEEEGDLKHPALLWTVAETRRVLQMQGQ